MTTATSYDTPRPIAGATSARLHSVPQITGKTRRPVAPMVAMVAGLAVLAVAAATLTKLPDRGRQETRPPAAPAFVGITLSERDVSVVTQVYEPGHDSGWHAHAGIHAVAVVSGALTVYDRECRAATFVPGRPYVGGRDIHLVRNETAAPVEMIVTYMNPTAPAAPGATPSGPPTCPSQG